MKRKHSRNDDDLPSLDSVVKALQGDTSNPQDIPQNGNYKICPILKSINGQGLIEILYSNKVVCIHSFVGVRDVKVKRGPNQQAKYSQCKANTNEYIACLYTDYPSYTEAGIDPTWD